MTDRAALIARYRLLTGVDLPAQAAKRRWPVHNHHCFQRIILDNICHGVWYDTIKRPAYQNMTDAQATQAVALCTAIMDGTVDLHQLNQNSLNWRKTAQRVAEPPAQFTLPLWHDEHT